MNEMDSQRLEQIRGLYDSGQYSGGLQQLRELARNTIDPWDKAELVYNEIMLLVEMHEISEARNLVTALNKAVASLIASPVDGFQFDKRISLPVLARHAELKVAIAEGKTLEAVALIDDLEARFPKQLSTTEFKSLADEIRVFRGILLADAGRWSEAKSILEEAIPSDMLKTRHSYYLGQAYYESREYDNAKKKLLEAINLGLEPAWESQARFSLGIIDYKLGEMKEAKREFELCARTADPKSVEMPKLWSWLEATSRRLGLVTEAEHYRELVGSGPGKIN